MGHYMYEVILVYYYSTTIDYYSITHAISAHILNTVDHRTVSHDFTRSANIKPAKSQLDTLGIRPIDRPRYQTN